MLPVPQTPPTGLYRPVRIHKHIPIYLILSSFPDGAPAIHSSRVKRRGYAKHGLNEDELIQLMKRRVELEVGVGLKKNIECFFLCLFCL